MTPAARHGKQTLNENAMPPAKANATLKKFPKI